MTSALLIASETARAASLSIDLESVGIHVHGAATSDTLVREAARQAPDVVVCWAPALDEALFQAAATLAANAPLPMVLFTLDPDVDKIERALRSGIQEVVVQGYAPNRLRSVLHTAIARFRLERELRDALADMTHRFEERKLVDRAKGVLMRARQMSEDDAFRALRTASMQNNQRMGQVAQQVIDSARSAEAVNRAGQLRMLSQRIVKLQALLACGCEADGVLSRLSASVDRVDHAFALLGQQLSGATFGDLLEALQAPWTELKPLLKAADRRGMLPAADALAERMLEAAERLTSALEMAGSRPTLAIINVCGRQRMLSQRLAKSALLSMLLDASEAARARDAARTAMEAFERALDHLKQAPLSNDEIRASLDASTRTWHELLSGAAQAGNEQGQAVLARASEDLLELFETLTDRYERSLQVLMGWEGPMAVVDAFR